MREHPYHTEWKTINAKGLLRGELRRSVTRGTT